MSSPLPLQTHDVLDDMLTSGGSPRDLTEQQCSQLRQFFEDTDVGLWFFIQHVFGFQDMRPDLHLPICRLVGHWGETHLTDGRIVTTPPGDEEERLLHRSYRRIMVRIPRECFKCLREDVLAHTPSGPKRVGELIPGDRLYTIGPDLQLAETHVIANHLKEAPLYYVRTKRGLEFRVTPNHRFRQMWGWKRADAIQVGEEIATVRRLPRPPLEADPKLCYLAGALVGDGCLRPQPDGFSVTFESCDSELVEKLDHITGGLRRRSRGTTFGVPSAWWHQLPRSMFCLSVDKTIPPEFEGSPDFLQGLFDTDGHVSATGTRRCVTLTTASGGLAEDVQRNLRYFGIVASKNGPYKSQGPNNFRGQVWYVQVSGLENLERFQKSIGFHHHEKQRKLQEILPQIPEKSSAPDGMPLTWRRLLKYGDGAKLRRAGIRVDNRNWTGRAKLREVAQALNSTDISLLAESNIHWDQVSEVRPIEPDIVAELQVADAHTYLAGCALHHNTSYFTRANSLWTVAKNPDATIGIFNEKEENVESWIDAIREVVENSVLFQVVWRHIIPRGIGFWDKEKGIGPSRKLKWGGGGLLFERSTHGVSELSIEGHGVGGATAGKHFTHTILDDIIGLKAQQSEAVMLQAIEWINKKRPLERPAENGCELVNHTTWAYGDVYEHMLRQWPGEYLVHKRSLLENPTTGEPDTVEGRSIFPEKISTLKAYRMLKADGFTFHAQYQNEPKAGKAQSFSEEHLHHFRIIEASDKLYLRIEDEDYDPQCYDLESGEQEAPQFVPLTLLDRAIIIDPAPSKGPEVKREPKSRNGLVAAGTDPWGRRFALQSVPSLEGPTEVLKQAIGLYRRWGGRIAIEEVIFSAVYWPLWQRIMELDPQYQDVRPEFRPLLTRNRDKDQRIRDNGIPDWENNRWYLNNAQCGHLEKEVLEFPYGETKDLVDAWSYTKEATDRPESFVEAESRHRSQMREQRGVTGYGW